MDELRGRTVQVVLHVREGLGFGFLKCPFVVTGSLNGYLLETDPVVPCHAPIFDAELVWEADKRKFRNLRIQNVPVKIEVHSTGTQGRRNKVGYLLLSLLSAQPRPSNKLVNISHTWHKLLGVKSEGKCCHPQLLMSLSVEDRTSTPTPRNELTLFHSNEMASLNLPSARDPTVRLQTFTLEDYLTESKRGVKTQELNPRLLCDEGLIQIGSSAAQHLFVLSFVIGAAENIDLLLPDVENESSSDSCYVTYSVFTHVIQTDRFPTRTNGVKNTTVQFNQKTSLRLCTDLSSLSLYFAECPYVVTRLCCSQQDVGVCSTDLRKLVMTDDVNVFLESFCNGENAITIGERCFMVPFDNRPTRDGRKPYIDIEISLKYMGRHINTLKPGHLTARSATELGCEAGERRAAADTTEVVLDKYKSASCTEVDRDVGSVTYTNITARNTSRYRNANGDGAIQSQNEIADLIRKMYESFATSQEQLLAKVRPATSDIQIQCNSPKHDDLRSQSQSCIDTGRASENLATKELKRDLRDEQIETKNEKELLKTLIPAEERDSIMKKCVEELEDWKAQQQDLFTFQLKQKEEYHLEMLSQEWTKRRSELEGKLNKGIEQCRNLAGDLSRATEDFRLRGFRNTEREKKLLHAKQSLEQHYASKFQELREASQKMEDDVKHEIKLKDMRIQELEAKVELLLKENETLKKTIKSSEKDAEAKYSGLTKDQTASLIQELRHLEEKLDNAVQSKSFFKEQWGRAVRELHFIKLQNRKQLLTQLHQHRQQLGKMGLDDAEDAEQETPASDKIDLQKLKDDFYVNLLASTPAIGDLTHNLHSSSSFVGGNELFSEGNKIRKKPADDKLDALMEERDTLMQQESPDEECLCKLNQQIRNILLNCGP